ncbi:MAG: preprotein translocase subunit SecA [Desulfobacterota bacterium]|nr:preprotein translocase subunit SecA [Thermodesulfobacteriota bacterium]
MIVSLIQKIFGTENERELKRLRPIVEHINELEPTFRAATDDQLKATTQQFRTRLENGEPLDDLLPEAFACVREVSRRVLNMRHFDVQLIGGIVLHQGKIAEMATGEGKTLVATLPAYLNALTGRGVHIVTVNDYLARRDREWMGKIYEFLGLTVDVLHHDISPAERKQAYQADITYGTNTEFGFDYLRDNMAIDAAAQVQRGHAFAIVDEVDSILIDEARTPLIISGPIERTGKEYFTEFKAPVERLMRSQNQLVTQLLNEAERLLEEGHEYEAGVKLLQVKRAAPKNKRFLKLSKEGKLKKLIDEVELDYMRDKRIGELDAELYFSIDERSNIIDLSDKGRHALSPHDPDLFVLPDLSMIDAPDALSDEERLRKRQRLEREFADKSEKLQSISQLLKAYSLFEKDVNYVVTEDGKVQIVDEFTGRLLPGRRYSDGLHQALEAKEGVRIEGETQTLAAITIQNYFRMYEKLAGMTGTAETEAHEFLKIYKLKVVVVPTNKPVRRIDYPDVVYKTKKEKYKAVIQEIERMHERGRPVLVGTVSVETSELLSRMLPKRIKHSVLNAKRHKEEAEIVARAGQSGAVTIATNMAGRGTDIKLGPGVVKCEQCCIHCEVEETEGCERCPDPQKQGKKMKQCFTDIPCGLHIIGTERHEARRIDRQLRGRSARQGDPGSSRFFLSLEDDLLRIFGADRISNIMDRFGMEEDQPIEHRLITRAIENAQMRVEARNFDIRKHLLEYDDVMNKQREIIYELRNRALHDPSLKDLVFEYVHELALALLASHWPDNQPRDDAEVRAFKEAVFRQFSTVLLRSAEELNACKPDEREAYVLDAITATYKNKEHQFGAEMMGQLEKWLYLRVLDELWKDHLLDMDHLREGIGLRGYAQQDPLREYQREAYDLFLNMVDRLKKDFIEKLFMVQMVSHDQMRRSDQPQKFILSRGEGEGEHKPAVRKAPKVGRNDPCPCGSGKKYKKCCGAT